MILTLNGFTTVELPGHGRNQFCEIMGQYDTLTNVPARFVPVERDDNCRIVVYNGRKFLHVLDENGDVV